jgi:hypothetical protein
LTCMAMVSVTCQVSTVTAWQLLTVIDMYGNGFGYLPSVAILDCDCLATPDGY